MPIYWKMKHADVYIKAEGKDLYLFLKYVVKDHVRHCDSWLRIYHKVNFNCYTIVDKPPSKQRIPTNLKPL